jgi:predicted RNA polymerase sigma factor
VTPAAEVVASAQRSEWARIVAGLIRLTGDWALAEDATSDAFATALVRWEADGTPPNPPAWLALTARNRAIELRDGTDAGLALLDALAPRLAGYRLLPAARADLLARAGRLDEAAEHYRNALALASAPAERAALTRRLGEASVAGPAGRA